MKRLTSQIIEALRAIVDDRGVLVEAAQLRTYECDGLTHECIAPEAVVLPTSAEQVQQVVRLCYRERIPIVARGAGTGLSGGALPTDGSIVLSLARMNRILEVDIPNRYVVVEPGVINAHVSERVAADGFFYAPDPSSLSVCTIGGNVAENAGGAHCLKYGFTVTHVLGLDVVLPDGELVHLGGAVPDAPGYDLAGVFVGSEGTLGIATRITLRVVRRPEAVQTLLAAFDSTDAAGSAVSAIIANGLLPAAVEMMDELSIRAAEAATGAGYDDCGALLLVEFDGPIDDVEDEMAQVTAICEARDARRVRVARSDAERAVLWRGRRAAFAAMGRISPNYIIQDGVIPRTALSNVLSEIDALARHYGLRVANVFHAGDGNLHPIVLYNRASDGEESRAKALSSAILQCCVSAGGSITGEHGVGTDKRDAMPTMFAEPDLETMQIVRSAFDPIGLANPGKIFPSPRLCGEKAGPYVPHPLETNGRADRF